MKRFFFSLLFFTSLLTPILQAQVVTGKLIKEGGEAISGLQLKLYIGSSIYSAISGSDGSFTFSGITSTERGNNLPHGYAISNNYPNPFNPKTRIEFSLPNSTKVKVEVFNLAGQLVHDAIEKQVNAGSGYIDIELKGLSNGAYFAKLSADGKYLTTKKLMLVYGSQHLNDSGVPSNLVLNRNNQIAKMTLSTPLDSIVISGTGVFDQVYKSLPIMDVNSLNLGNLIVTNLKTEKVIDNTTGGNVTTTDGAVLTIPANALPVSGNIYIGKSGKEPTTVANTNIIIVGNSYTIGFPADSINSTVHLSFVKPDQTISTENYWLCLYNGSTYYPMSYSINGDTVTANIDVINWEASKSLNKVSSTKKTNTASEIIINSFKSVQTPPVEEMGLKEITISNDKLVFSTPIMNSCSKMLLLIHGWKSHPSSSWETMIKRIVTETGLNYSKILTFGYNSSWSISVNSLILLNALSQNISGSKVDIVAHSMGGLIARDMIEDAAGSQYVNKLITLGTPHLGSPLAALRGLIGHFILNNSDEYYDNTEGMADLSPNSSIIQKLQTLNHDSIPYFLIAAMNRPNILFGWVSRNYLQGLDDGVVSVASAKGVPAVADTATFYIPEMWAHTYMTTYESIYQKILTYLRLGSPAKPVPVTPYNLASNQSVSPTLSWTASEGANSYYLQVSITNTFAVKTVDQDVGNSTNQQLSGLHNNTTYYWRVKATGSCGTSEWSEVWSFTTTGIAPNAPVLSAPDDMASGQSITPILSWNSSIGAISYYLQVSVTNTFEIRTFDQSVGANLSQQVAGLLNSQTYYWRVFATNTYGDSEWSDIWSFTTANSSCSLAGGVQIGTQCWMKRNLNIGTMIMGTQAQADNGVIEKYCYDNDPSNCATYGGLYQWNEAMQYVTTSGTQGICPSGWHIPNWEDMSTLYTYVNHEGNALKAVGQGTGDGAGTNTSGFSALLGGFRNTGDAIFYYMGIRAFFWISNQLNTERASYSYLDTNYDLFDMGYSFPKDYGFNVRCVKD